MTSPFGAANGDPLPVDSDVEVNDVAAKPARPAHLQPRHLVLVAAGGAVGTGMRETLGLLLPPVAGIPFTTAGINVVGALTLGFLLETLTRFDNEVGLGRTVRLLVGTGLLGGFTTYSAMATDTVLLLSKNTFVGIAYALGTVLLGAAATGAGIVAASRLNKDNRL